MFNSNQGTNPARSISPQYCSPVFAAPSTSPPFFGSKGPNLLEGHFRRQSMPSAISTTCECNPKSALVPTRFPPLWSEACRQHQIPTTQHEVLEERQNICCQSTPSEEPCSRTGSSCTNLYRPSVSEHEQRDWQNQGIDLTSMSSPLSRISIPTQGRLPSEAHLLTPINSAPSSLTKSPLLTAQSALPSNQPVPNPYLHDTTAQSSATRRTASTDLETRFELIFDAIEEAGFDSIDSMAGCYYTTTFPPNSLCASAQSLSRRRHLRKFLEDIRESARGWDAGESQGYQDGIIMSATCVYVDELGWLKDRGCSGTAGAGVVASVDSMKRIRDAALDDEMVRVLKDEKRLLRERVSFLLSPCKSIK